MPPPTAPRPRAPKKPSTKKKSAAAAGPGGAPYGGGSGGIAEAEIERFYTGVRQAWEDANLPPKDRKTPVIGEEPLDLHDLYRRMKRVRTCVRCFCECVCSATWPVCIIYDVSERDLLP